MVKSLTALAKTAKGGAQAPNDPRASGDLRDDLLMSLVLTNWKDGRCRAGGPEAISKRNSAG